MDYENLIDDETWTFIRETEDYYPSDTVTADIATQRAIYDRMCRAFFKGYPSGVTAQDSHAGSVPIRIYERGVHDTTLIYFHGGGFVVGGLESHDDVCAELCDKANVRVVSVDYRLSPENKHPAAFNDAMSAVEYVALTWPNKVLLAGDSAGGNLAASVAHAARGTQEFSGLLLIYPGLGGEMTRGSYLDHAHAPMLSLDDLKFYEAARFDGVIPNDDTTAAPLVDKNFSDLPPTMIFTAECDPLADDGRDYRDALTSAGTKARWINEPGLVHGYLRARSSVKRARDSFERIIDAIKMFAADDWYD